MTKQRVGDGRTTLHGYSADGERVGTWDSVTGGITYVLRGLDNKPLRQYREFNGGWTWQKDWVYRDGLVLATIETSGTKYFHLDHLGTPRRITNSSRAVIASHDYYPFGEEITASSQDTEALKFTGHERDLRDPSKTTDDLDYMHARFYNPTIARFLSTDPIGGSPGAPQSWNRYSYALNNPLKYTDPDGEWLHTAIGAGVGAALNAGAKAIQNSAEGRPVTEGLGKAALVGAAGGAVTAATFGMGAALLTGGGAAGAIATLSSTASIPTLTATGGLIVGGTASGLGGAVTGAGNEAVVQGNTNPQDLASAAVTFSLKSVPLGAGLGAAGAGPVTAAVAGEISTVADAGYKYVAKELADSLATEKEPE